MAANCNYKVKLIGALDMLRFKNCLLYTSDAADEL